MVISFGTGYADTTKFDQEMCPCPYCKENKVFVQSGQSFFYLMWMPLIPLGKNYDAWCRNCGTAYTMENTTGPTADYVEKMIKGRGFSIWVQPAALIFVAAIVGFVLFLNR